MVTDKALAYALFAEQKAVEIASSPAKWAAFLHTASRMYKYDYFDQLLIHAQRPDATACASYEIWNQRMNRYIKRGHKGIGLLDIKEQEMRLHYVFDVSDTGTRPNSLPVELWQLDERHEVAVIHMLSREYGVPDNIPLADQFVMIASQHANIFWQNNYRAIEDLDLIDGTESVTYDRGAIGSAFRRAAAASTAYVLMLRCGEPADQYISREDMRDVMGFSSPEALATLGSAVSSASGQVLRQIERTVKSIERSREENDRTDLHPERGLLASEPGRAGEDAAAGNVREDAPKWVIPLCRQPCAR